VFAYIDVTNRYTLRLFVHSSVRIITIHFVAHSRLVLLIRKICPLFSSMNECEWQCIA